MAENSANVERSGEPALSKASNPVIWLVNDDPAQLLVQKRLLGRFAESVTAFSSPLEAVAAAREGGSSPLLVTDYNMPVMKGPQLAAYWCALHPQARILILSASEISEEDSVLESLPKESVQLLSSYRLPELSKAAQDWFCSAEGAAVQEEAAGPGNSRLETSVLEKLMTLGGPPFVEKVLSRFVSELPGRMETLEQAFSGNDRELVHRTAHSLKGSCGLIGAEKLARVAGALENASAPDIEEDLTPHMESLKAEFELTFQEVQDRL